MPSLGDGMPLTGWGLGHLPWSAFPPELRAFLSELCLCGLGVALGLLATHLLHPCLTAFPPPSHCPASLPLIQSLRGACLKCGFLGWSLQGEAIKFGL